MQLVLRHILVSTRAIGAVPPRSGAEAQRRAEQVLGELRGGVSFEDAAKKYSDDTYRKRNGGRIPHYRKGLFGEAFDVAVRALTKENPLSGVIASPRGYHIAQLVDRRVTRFDAVAEELRKAVQRRPATPRERNLLLRRLRDGAKIEAP